MDRVVGEGFALVGGELLRAFLPGVARATRWSMSTALCHSPARTKWIRRQAGTVAGELLRRLPVKGRAPKAWCSREQFSGD